MREPVDLGLVVRDALSMAGQPGPVDAPGVVADLAAGPLVVEADRRALVQVLINLIGNATKFTGADGRVTVRLLLTQDGRPGFEVTDTGIGIPADRLADLCRPFVQIENVYSRERRGTGMGLYISRSLVDLHGGSFEIESRETAGTTVRVLLPADRLVPARRLDNDAAASSGAGL
ncbi:sensor histidine kinase [Tistrella bauzanensis]